MKAKKPLEGHAVVIQPEDGTSYWQPRPANGFASPKLIPENTNFGALSMGYQTIAEGGRVREHSHPEQIEIQICFRGKGHINIDGVKHKLHEGSACFLGYNVKHEIVNEGCGDLVMIWIISPGGLESFFKSIGRPRSNGQSAPEPFDRPKDIITLERSMGVNDT